MLGRDAQLLEDRETHLPAEAACCAPRDNKLQGHRADVGDVEVECNLLKLEDKTEIKYLESGNSYTWDEVKVSVANISR